LKVLGDIEIKLIPGGGGVFDVEVDSQRVYSKHATGRFPNQGEVLEAIRAKA